MLALKFNFNDARSGTELRWASWVYRVDGKPFLMDHTKTCSNTNNTKMTGLWWGLYILQKNDSRDLIIEGDPWFVVSSVHQKIVKSSNVLILSMQVQHVIGQMLGPIYGQKEIGWQTSSLSPPLRPNGRSKYGTVFPLTTTLLEPQDRLMNFNRRQEEDCVV